MSGDVFALFFPGRLLLEGGLSLRGYASRYARLDVLARTALLLKDLSPESTVYAWITVGDEETIVDVRPASCPGSERAAMMEILRALLRGESECARAYLMSAERLLHWASKKWLIVRLAEDGMDIGSYRLAGRPIMWVMGAHREPPPRVEKMIMSYAVAKVSIGPLSYLASHTAAFIAWWRSLEDG